MTTEDRCPVVHFDHNSADHLEQTGGRYRLQRMCDAGGMANATVVELI